MACCMCDCPARRRRWRAPTGSSAAKSSMVPPWRLSLPPAFPPLALAGDSLLEWGGALRWLKTSADAATVRKAVEQAGGHAWLFRGCAGDDRFHPLPPALLAVQQRVKQAFDPKGIFN